MFFGSFFYSCRGIHYIVQPGDTLYTISRRFHISLQALIMANPQITNPNLIFPGQVICIPVQVSCPGGFPYIVQPGDSLYYIAIRFNVSLQTLIAANPQIVNPNLIYPGQVICIPRMYMGM
ncbi:MAG: SafA/ExsA family spore coat assembly protein [Bacillota bacterium]